MKLSTTNLLLMGILSIFYCYSMDQLIPSAQMDRQLAELITIPSTLNLSNNNEKICWPQDWPTKQISAWENEVTQRRKHLQLTCNSELLAPYERCTESIQPEQKYHLEIKKLALKAQLLKQKVAKIELETENNRKECEKLQQKLHHVEEKNRKSTKKIALLEQDFAEKKKTVEESEKQNTPATKKIESSQIITETMPLHLKKLLLREHKAKTISDLRKKLSILSYSLYQFPEKNKKETGPNFKTEGHLLIKAIKNNYLLIFCPCTGSLSLTQESYSSDPAVVKALSEDFLCKKPCKNNIIAWAELFKKFLADDEKSLRVNLKRLVNIYYNNNNNIDPTISSFFDKEKHLLIGKINEYWIYTFCPCNENIGLVEKQNYPCSFDEIKKTIPDNFLCQNCLNYPPKKCIAQFDSRSSDSDCQNGSEICLTKSDMEEI